MIGSVVHIESLVFCKRIHSTIHRHDDLQLFLLLRCCKDNWSLQCGLSDFWINISIRYEKQISQCVCAHCGVVSSTALWAIIIILHCPPSWSVFLNGGWEGFPNQSCWPILAVPLLQWPLFENDLWGMNLLLSMPVTAWRDI